MKTVAIDTDEQIGQFAKKNKIQIEEIPLADIILEDRKNKGYHFTYVTDLLKSVKNIKVNLPTLFLYGSGKYHYMCYAILRNFIDKQHSDYTIINIDNHADMESPRTKQTSVTNSSTRKIPINCATHLFQAMIDSNCIDIIHIKKTKQGFCIDAYQKDGSCLEIIEDEKDIKSTIAELIDNTYENIYLTIDIDVLSEKEVTIKTSEKYDQGHMETAELLKLIKAIKKNKTVLSADICGMSEDKRSKEIYRKIMKEI